MNYIDSKKTMSKDVKWEYDGLKPTYVIDEINLLQARCDRFRNILIEIGYVKLENLEEFLAEGKLTPNDVRYLYGLDEIDKPKSYVGKRKDVGIIDDAGQALVQGFDDGMKGVTNENNI